METLLEILTKRRSLAFYKLIGVYSVPNFISESISDESVVNNLKEKKLPAQMNRNHFDLILARRYCSCSKKIQIYPNMEI